MNILNYIKLIVILILFALLVNGFFYIEDDIAFLVGTLGVLLVLLVFRIISNAIKQRKKNNILKHNKQVNAKIISTKIQKGKTHVLQLSIKQNDTNYIVGYVLKPNTNQVNKYQKGKSINVFINPSNPSEIVIPELQKEEIQHSNKNGGFIVWVVVILLSVGIPLIINILDDSGGRFEEMAYIETDSNAYIWELYHEPDEELLIKIYNPTTGKKIKTVKSEINVDTKNAYIYSIIPQNQNFFIINIGLTPYLEIYNGHTFEKISGLEEFVQSNKKMKSGIAKMNKKSYSSKFVDDVILEITTNDAKELFYNISKDTFYYSDKELKKYIDKTDSEIMSDKLVSFALAPVEGNNYQKLLYIINSTSKKDKDDLLKLVAYTNFDIGVFQRSKRYECKKCKENLLQEEPFLESNFLFVDTSIVVISSIESLGQDADEMITCYDKTAKKLFQINESDYPNYKEMQEKNIHPRNQSMINCARVNDKLIINFDYFGALGIDLKTGKQIWKFEP